jgi:hypothetical protein
VAAVHRKMLLLKDTFDKRLQYFKTKIMKTANMSLQAFVTLGLERKSTGFIV